MLIFIITAFATGLLFALMDGLINANPYALKLMEYYKPIAKKTINVKAGLLIDLFYGFAISGIYLLIEPALPAGPGILKGLIYGVGMWFFRVVMRVLSDWMMFNIPVKTLWYMSWTGLIEMLILGALNGILLNNGE